MLRSHGFQPPIGQTLSLQPIKLLVIGHPDLDLRMRHDRQNRHRTKRAKPGPNANNGRTSPSRVKDVRMCNDRLCARLRRSFSISSVRTKTSLSPAPSAMRSDTSNLLGSTTPQRPAASMAKCATANTTRSASLAGNTASGTVFYQLVTVSRSMQDKSAVMSRSAPHAQSPPSTTAAFINRQGNRVMTEKRVIGGRSHRVCA